MDYKSFMSSMTAYYGKYSNDFVSGIVMEYIRENIKESDLDNSFKKIVSEYTNKYKTPPDIVTIKKILTVSHEISAEKAWLELVNQSCVEDVLIVDEYSYMAVRGYGNWMEFCENVHSNKDWVHKGFVKRYCLFSESGVKETPRILSGAIKCLYGGSNYKTTRKIRIIGDIEKGNLLLKSGDSGKIDFDRIKIL